MEDYKRTNSAETDSSDDDEDDDDESTSRTSKPTRVSRAILGKVTAEKASEKKQARARSLGERIFQKKEESSEGSEKKAEDKAEAKDEPEIEAEESQTSKDEELTVEETEEVEPEGDAQEEIWEEGDITEDGEINLSRQEQHNEVESPEVENEEAETIWIETSPPQTEEMGDEADLPAEEIGYASRAEASNDGGDELPPDNPEHESENPDDLEPRRPARDDGSSVTSTVHLGSPTERFTREQDTRLAEDAMNEAIYRATKLGQNRGVVAGLLGGLYLGHRGKKKLSQTFEKTIEAKDGEIKQLKTTQAGVQERLGAAQSRDEHSRAEKVASQAVSSSERPTAVVNRAEAMPASQSFMRIESVPGAPVSSRLEALSAAPLLIGAETLRRQLSSRERVRYAMDERGNMDIQRSSEQPISKDLPLEERPITEDMYLTPEGRRVEMSAWHRMEIDQKTGKVVNNPEVAYGDEFRREIQQEVLRSQRGYGGKGSATQLGSVASASASSQGSPSQGQQPAAVPAYPIATLDATSAQSPNSDDDNDDGVDPMIWIIGAAFVVILFLFAILR